MRQRRILEEELQQEPSPVCPNAKTGEPMGAHGQGPCSCETPRATSGHRIIFLFERKEERGGTRINFLIVNREDAGFSVTI
jgi:hypothetical protein